MLRITLAAGVALAALALPAHASARACSAAFTATAPAAGTPVQIVGVVTRVRVDAVRVVHGHRSLRFAVTTALLPCRIAAGMRVQATGVRVGRVLYLTSLTKVHHAGHHPRRDDDRRHDRGDRHHRHDRDRRSQAGDCALT
jgi:hypothetical protein